VVYVQADGLQLPVAVTGGWEGKVGSGGQTGRACKQARGERWIHKSDREGES
jgi:hypothetical protein